MAEKKEEFEMNNFSSSLQYFENRIRFILSESLTYSDSHFLHSKRNLCRFGALLKSKSSRTSKKSGDLIVNLKDTKTQELEALKANICQSPALKQYLISGNVDLYSNIHFYIDQKLFIKNVFEMVLASGPNYGQTKKPMAVNQQVLMNSVDHVLADKSSRDDITVGQLWTVLLCNHMAEILHQNRYTVQRCDCLINPSLVRSRTNNVLSLFDTPKYNMQPATACAVCPEKLESVNSILKSNLIKSKYRVEDIGTGIMKDSKSDHHELLINKHLLDTEEENDHLLRASEDSISEDLDSEKISYSGLLLSDTMDLADNNTNTGMSLGKTRLNLQKFLEELKTFKREGDCCVACDKNLKEVYVITIWDDICYLEMIANEMRIQNGKNKEARIIHVCGQEKQFHLQKIALTWRILSESDIAKKQMFLCHGSVAFYDQKSLLNKSVSVCELLSIRTKQVKHSYFMKYGPIVNDESWAATITKIAISVIKLELLLAPLKTQVKIDVTDSNNCSPGCRQALFVLYNCARLAKIMEHHDNGVKKGIYPLLPDINDVDFSLLKDEAEWSLIMKYIVIFPDIVVNVAQSFQDDLAVGKFNSNKIALFLVSLSHDISAYYSRVHILGEPRAHLLPTMFARLYLVKVLYQVIQNALQLLTIDSINQM